MPSLPASVRLGLWATRAMTEGGDVETALRLATPDADHIDGATSTLRAWSDLGERVVLCALARPGHLGDLPRGDGAFVDAATRAGECAYVPGVGGALVPDIDSYGPADDEGLAVRWRTHAADPLAPHVVDAWSLREVERHLTEAIADAVDVLTAVDAGPWASRGLRDLAQERLDTATWGLPDGIPPRAARLIARAGIVSAAAQLGLDSPDDGLVRAATERRRRVLSDLVVQADAALTRATNVAALHLAGLRPGRDD